MALIMDFAMACIDRHWQNKSPELSQAPGLCSTATHYQWNCSSSVEPVSAVTDEAPPWITVVMSSK